MRRYWDRSAFLAVILVAFFVSGAIGQNRVTLFSAEEAARLRLAPGEMPPRPLQTRSVALGPRVVIKQPKVDVTSTGNTIRTRTPTAFLLVFEENKAPVNMASLEIRAKKGIFSKSLVPLLAPYIQGTTIQVGELEIPAGRFNIEIEIADRAGTKTTEIYVLDVTQ